MSPFEERLEEIYIERGKKTYSKIMSFSDEVPEGKYMRVPAIPCPFCKEDNIQVYRKDGRTEVICGDPHCSVERELEERDFVEEVLRLNNWNGKE